MQRVLLALLMKCWSGAGGWTIAGNTLDGIALMKSIMAVQVAGTSMTGSALVRRVIPSIGRGTAQAGGRIRIALCRMARWRRRRGLQDSASNAPIERRICAMDNQRAPIMTFELQRSLQRRAAYRQLLQIDLQKPLVCMSMGHDHPAARMPP